MIKLIQSYGREEVLTDKKQELLILKGTLQLLDTIVTNKEIQLQIRDEVVSMCEGHRRIFDQLLSRDDLADEVKQLCNKLLIATNVNQIAMTRQSSQSSNDQTKVNYSNSFSRQHSI